MGTACTGSTSSVEKSEKIYVAGHRGLAGSAIVRQLRAAGYENLVLRTHAELELTDGAGCIEMDPNELEQLLLNLVLNARDAIEESGVLTIATDLCLSGKCGRMPVEKPCVCVNVHDTGVGMSAETLEHIFDPFFTTKEVGKGTGLGLSVCQGLVEAAGGHLDLCNTQGTGACFRLRLPTLATSSSEMRPLARKP